MKQAFDDNGLRHLELEFLMDWFLDPDDERRRASDQTRDAALRRRRRARRPSHQGRQHPGHAGRALAAHGALRRALRRRRRAHRREDRLRVHAVRRERPEHRRRARGRRRRGRRERRHRDRHVAHVEARHRARRAAPDPDRVPVVDRAQRRPVRRHGRPDRRDRQPPPAARRGRVRHPRLRRGLPGSRLPRAVGRRGALRGAAQQPDRRDLPAGLRDDRRPIRTERSST